MSLALVFSIKRYLFLPFGLEARRGTTPSLRNEARAGCFPRVGHAYNKRPEEAKSGRAEIRLRGKKEKKSSMVTILVDVDKILTGLQTSGPRDLPLRGLEEAPTWRAFGGEFR